MARDGGQAESGQVGHDTLQGMGMTGKHLDGGDPPSTSLLLQPPGVIEASLSRTDARLWPQPQPRPWRRGDPPHARLAAHMRASGVTQRGRAAPQPPLRRLCRGRASLAKLARAKSRSGIPSTPALPLIPLFLPRRLVHLHTAGPQVWSTYHLQHCIDHARGVAPTRLQAPFSPEARGPRKDF